MADHAECLRAGAAVHATAKRLGKSVIFIASTALSHALVRGRHHMPTPERMAADQVLIEQLKQGSVDSAIAGFTDYSRLTVAEMGGRALATFLGALKAMGADGGQLQGRQYGDYAQSSGSGNANILVATEKVLNQIN
jgi:3,4-dihydroxyphenylacetate 2,3-dioxygenase